MDEYPPLEDFDGQRLYGDGGQLKKFVTIIDGEKRIVDGNGNPIDRGDHESAVDYYRRIHNQIID